jgi:hypothetical protein
MSYEGEKYAKEFASNLKKKISLTDTTFKAVNPKQRSGMNNDKDPTIYAFYMWVKGGL